MECRTTAGSSTRMSLPIEFSTLPEAVARPEENEKEVAGAGEKQVHELSVPPQALDPEGDKEWVSSVLSDKQPLTGTALERKEQKRILGLSTRWWIIAAAILLSMGVVISAVLGGVEGSRK